MEVFDFKEVNIINSGEPLLQGVALRINRRKSTMKPAKGEVFTCDEAEKNYKLSYLEMDSATLKKAILV